MMIREFDSADELFDAIRRERDEADAKVKPWQSAIKTGDFVMRIVEGFETPIVIFSKLVEPEYEEDREHYAQPHMKNFRFGWHYSVACAGGEPGDVHVAAVQSVITEEMFNQARDADWGLAVVQSWLAQGWLPDFKKH